MNITDYKKIASTVASGRVVHWENYFEPVRYIFNGFVKAKERPRVGKGGNVYTAKETRQFEKTVAEWAIAEKMEKLTFPIEVTLSFYDKTDDNHLVQDSINGLVYQMKKDLDNLAKAVLDGLNGIAYRDDRQIVTLNVRRRYSHSDGFCIEIRRGGLGKSEYTQYRKIADGK